ncbi:MAG TPA: PhzF family phenazine biosynthesis isomerase, partial [Steroidobacteraceae bacterium]|nr:PhzF family phenazine biosynthesis isomerase [Steroidobacteraceae bacterium]
ARAGIDAERWRTTLGGYWTQQVFIFCRDPELEGSNIRARMYAPEFGIPEDPATGSAAAALGGYLGARAPESDGTLRWVVEQGFEMGRPSLLHVETDKEAGRITAVRVGGNSVLVSEGTLQVD